MHNVLSLFILMITLLIGYSPVVYAAHASEPRLGINVEGIHKLKSSLPFTDLFKISSGWFTSCEFDWQKNIPIDSGCSRKNSFNTREQASLKLDKNGWVRSLPTSEDPEIFTSVVSGLHLDKDFPLGRYVLLYKGKGEIAVSGALNIVGEKRPGRIVFDLIATQRGIKIKINKTDRRNYIRDIHLVSIENEDSFSEQPFNTDYLERLQPFEAIRFMPWTNPRRTQLVDWDQHPTPKHAHYTGSAGVPIETMLALANSIDAAPWLNIPHKASDKFMRSYARLAKKYVRRDKKIYIEFSNEMWNVIFPATSYAIKEASVTWPHVSRDKNSYEQRVKLANNWYGKRSVEMCRIWKKVFGRQKHRVVCMMASQSNVEWVGREALDCPLWSGGPCGSQVDAYAVGPYFGDYIAKIKHRETVNNWVKSSNGMDQLFKEIEQGGVLPDGPEGGAIQHFVETHMKISKQLADDYGLPLLAYEAGQHLIRYDPPHKITDSDLLDFFMRANLDPRMKQSYQRYLRAWEENGGKTLMHFYGIGQLSPNDFFGMLPSAQAKPTPKYKALLSYLLRKPYTDTSTPSRPLSDQELHDRRVKARKAHHR